MPNYFSSLEDAMAYLEEVAATTTTTSSGPSERVRGGVHMGAAFCAVLVVEGNGNVALRMSESPRGCDAAKYRDALTAPGKRGRPALSEGMRVASRPSPEARIESEEDSERRERLRAALEALKQAGFSVR